MRLYANGLPGGMAEQAAAVVGGSIEHTSPPAGDVPLDSPPYATVIINADDETLSAALSQPVRYLFALSDKATEDVFRPPYLALDDEGVVFEALVSVKTAYATALPAVVSHALSQRLDLPMQAQMNMEIALSEAITNGMIHGCLGLSSPEDRFDSSYITNIEERLNSPDYANSGLRIAAKRSGSNSLTITISDDGEGFTPPPEADLQTPERLCRGLGLILSATETMTFKDNGTCLEMKFSL